MHEPLFKECFSVGFFRLVCRQLVADRILQPAGKEPLGLHCLLCGFLCPAVVGWLWKLPERSFCLAGSATHAGWLQHAPFFIEPDHYVTMEVFSGACIALLMAATRQQAGSLLLFQGPM